MKQQILSLTIFHDVTLLCQTKYCDFITLENIYLSFFSFPDDPKLRALWIKAMNRKNWIPKSYSKICSAHFLDSDLNKTYFSKNVYVREGVIPSVFPAFPKYLEKTTRVSLIYFYFSIQCIFNPTKLVG